VQITTKKHKKYKKGNTTPLKISNISIIEPKDIQMVEMSCKEF
jgi:hypothetical protein